MINISILFDKIIRRIPDSLLIILLKSSLIRNYYKRNYTSTLYKKNKIIREKILPLYTENALECHDDKKCIIYMSDNYLYQGGLCDKLRAIVSLYSKAIEKGMDFKIHFTYPFLLSDYLIPNEYNWLSQDSLRRSKDSIPFRLTYYVSPYAKVDIGIRPENTFEEFLINNQDKREYHIYSNAFWQNQNFGKLFHQLFKPTVSIQNKLNEIIKDHSSYISMSFRFLNILGDFKDTWVRRELDPIERGKYLKDCIELIKNTYKRHSKEVNKVFIASDSITLLNEASKLDFVFVIPGDVKHTELSSDDYTKVFLDFFMISKAQHVYMCMKKKMFTTSFPYYAALSGNKPFNVLMF